MTITFYGYILQLQRNFYRSSLYRMKSSFVRLQFDWILDFIKKMESRLAWRWMDDKQIFAFTLVFSSLYWL